MSNPKQTPPPVIQAAGIWGKLFQIQRGAKTFAITDDSEKTDARSGKSAYRYTPGWKIVETIRESMDALGLMLIPEVKFEKIELIEYPVYKMIGGSPMSFTKKEMHIAVSAEFTWVDVTTGEKAGPYKIVASGANGTDKSTASALALAERYFLLKFFHISTRDVDEEPDAHDSDSVPGIPKAQQQPATQAQACSSVPVPSQAPGYAGMPQYGGYQQGGRGFAPQASAPAVPGQQVNIYPAPPQYIQPGALPQGAQGFNDNNPAIRDAIARLANFERGTVSHRTVLNECIGTLSAAGIVCTDPTFVDNLSEAAQALRENRKPAYK